jgi:Peptidase family M23
MKKLGQAGSHSIIVILLILVIAVAGIAGWQVLSRGDNSGNNEGQQNRPSTQQAGDEDKLQLQNLGVLAIAPYDAGARTSGDLLITNDALREFDSKGMKGFYVFGEPLPGEGSRINPNFEFAAVKEDAQIVAAIDGVIGFIKQQEGDDYEVFLQPKEGSAWTIGYDHLKNLKVKKGDTVKAGDSLGNPVVQNNGLARFEIQINYDKNGQTTHYCPSSLLAESVKQKLLSQLTDVMDTWESISGKNLYDQAAQKLAGCVKETLSVSEAEGRS